MTTISANNYINIYPHVAPSTNLTYTTESTFGTISTWPVTIVNTGVGTSTTLVVSFASGVTLSSSTNYFICGTNNITFDGSYNVISLSNITGWPGFIQNGSSTTNGNNNIGVQNIFISSGSSTLASGADWTTQQYFGKNSTNNKVINTSANLIGI